MKPINHWMLQKNGLLRTPVRTGRSFGRLFMRRKPQRLGRAPGRWGGGVRLLRQGLVLLEKTVPPGKMRNFTMEKKNGSSPMVENVNLQKWWISRISSIFGGWTSEKPMKNYEFDHGNSRFRVVWRWENGSIFRRSFEFSPDSSALLTKKELRWNFLGGLVWFSIYIYIYTVYTIHNFTTWTFLRYSPGTHKIRTFCD